MYTISMERYLKFVFVFFLLSAFLFEGLGINNGREVAYNLILLMPFFFFFPRIIFKSGKKIFFPLKFSALFSLFIVFCLLSSLQSVNLQNSFQNLFLYIALFLVFIFVFNYKDLVRGLIIPLIFSLSFIFSVFSLFSVFFIQENSIFSVPITLSRETYQFIYSNWSHNNLGDFLLLTLTIIIYRLVRQRFKFENLLLFLFFIPFFIFAYSRSAYLDLALVILLIFYLLFRQGKLKLKSSLFFALCSLYFVLALAILVFAVPTNTNKPAVLNTLNATLQQKFDLNAGKQFFAYRNYYITEGLFSLANNPLFGLGPGNFGYASGKYMISPIYYSDTGHNLFFDIFVGNGLLAGAFFLLLFLQVFHSIKSTLFNDQKSINSSIIINHKSPARIASASVAGGSAMQQSNNLTIILIFIFTAMFLNFMTNYTFNIYSYFLLFFVIMGLIYEESATVKQFNDPARLASRARENIAGRLTIGIFSIFLFLIFNLTIISNISMAKKNYTLAFYFYPLNENVYVPLINSELVLGHKSLALSHLGLYTSLFKGDSDVLTYAGNVYYQYKGEKQALPYYEKAFEANNFFIDPALVKRVYQIKLSLEGQKRAKVFADTYFSKLSKAAISNSLYDQMYYRYRLSALSVCKGIYSGNCPYAL